MPAPAPSSPASPAPALDALMARHDGLVHAVLRRQWPGTLSYEERLHAGRIGLWQALQSFDPARGTAFSSYAWPAIARHIWRAVRQSTPRSASPLAMAMPKDIRLSPRRLACGEWRSRSPRRVAFGDLRRPPQSAPPLDNPDQALLDQALLQQEVVHTLHTLVQALPPALRRVVVAYYGLADHPPQSLRQIGRHSGLSHETVRLHLWAALVWLRHPSHSLPLRQLLDLNTVTDYQHADELAQTWLRKRGGRRVR